jgi:hypothetical protein
VNPTTGRYLPSCGGGNRRRINCRRRSVTGSARRPRKYRTMQPRHISP